MPDGKVGVGLIGLGFINRPHVRGYREAAAAARVVAVCDVNAALAAERAAELGAVPYTDYTAMLDDPAVEAVDITLPHNLHYPVAGAALARGKHVLVEKPLAATSAECLDLIDLARRQGRTFTVAENTRFVAAYIEAEKVLRRGALGTPRLIRTFISGSEVDRLQDTRLWKGRRDGSVGGTIFDAGPHSFYLIKWLLGEIAEVQAFQDRLVPQSEVEDHAVVGGSLASGALFTTEYTFTAEIPWSERCEIYGSRGSLVIDQLSNPPAIHYRHRTDYEGVPLNVPFEPREWKTTSIALGVQDFIAAIQERRSPCVDVMDGYYAIKVVEKAYESIASSGQRLPMYDRSGEPTGPGEPWQAYRV